MTSQLLDSFNMETNFEGLIQLLAKHLYSEPDVFVRELIQNAHDGIQRRRAHDADHAGRIDIELRKDEQAIYFSDNGLGMDETDIRQFLSVIGNTGTGTERQRLQEEGKSAAYDLIGQFGIGMLSAFVVAEKVVVRTRKLGEGQTFEWHNTGSAACELYSAERDLVGSDVIVHVNSDYQYMFDAERIKDIVKRYCDFLQFPIYVNGDGPVNAIDAPWHREIWPNEREKREAYSNFLNRRYPDIPLDVIPIEEDEPYHLRGALYISDRHIPDINTAGVVDIFVRRMFIKEGDSTVLPPWAKFVRGVIDSNDLQPTAARDALRTEDPAFKVLRERLGEIIVQRLEHLAQNERAKFERINRWHHYHLKGMAVIHDDFFEKVVDYLLFETNRGYMSLEDYLGKNPPRDDMDGKTPLYYFAYHGASAQFYRLADEHGWVVINAGNAFDEELLDKYARAHSRTVERVLLDESDDPNIFKRLTPDEEDRFQQLEIDMEGRMTRLGLQNVSVRLRRFAPQDVPAIVIMEERDEAMRGAADTLRKVQLVGGFAEINDEVIQRLRQQRMYLSLNADNPIVQHLADLPDRNHPVTEDIMRGLYNSAILYSHNLLNEKNAQIIHKQFIMVLERALNQYSEIGAVQRELEETRRELINLRQRGIEMDAQRPDHILLFMITPFSEEYAVVEEAVRNMFEQAPYFFEVRLARDYTLEPGLLDNVREHMRRAHGFIAEVSDLNPNVMFEVGAAMISDDVRPVFALRNDDAKEVPADFRERLHIRYGALDDGVSAITDALRDALERDGRPSHEGIVGLLNKRQKHFLSRTLLSNLSVNLSEDETKKTLGKYHTVESFLNADEADIAQITGIRSHLIPAIQGDLREMVDG